jgi:hypothetical protein
MQPEMVCMGDRAAMQPGVDVALHAQDENRSCNLPAQVGPGQRALANHKRPMEELLCAET